MAPLRRLADAAGRLPLSGELRFARMSASSIASPDATGLAQACAVARAPERFWGPEPAATSMLARIARQTA